MSAGPQLEVVGTLGRLTKLALIPVDSLQIRVSCLSGGQVEPCGEKGAEAEPSRPATVSPPVSRSQFCSGSNSGSLLSKTRAPMFTAPLNAVTDHPSILASE